MENYSTQMDAARRGIVTDQIKIVAEKEKMSVPGYFNALA